MRTVAAAVLAGAAGLCQGQQTLTPGAEVSGTLDGETNASFTVALEADTFVAGYADQRTVDVVVWIKDADGANVARFDEPARGPERFRFTAERAGTYTIELEGFEGAGGDYGLILTTVEPVATEPGARVDQLFEAYDGEGVPGAVVAVYRDGKPVFTRAFGAADLTCNTPWSTETVTNIGSTSKQFTALAICLLERQGKLSLDDDVREHLPELPDFGTPVTLRHMLTHTTGYREFLNLLAMEGRQLNRGDVIDRDEIVTIVERQPELQNEPGGEWNYNNTSYALLTLVVERVSGTPFPEWMDQNVFGPLGMHDTRLRTGRGEVIQGMARGYTTGEGGVYVEAMDLGGSMGAGGIYTTVEDLGRWIANLQSADLGGAGVIEAMTTPYELSSGRPTGYGLGLFIDEVNGHARWQHGGADTAHRSQLMYFPEFGGAVVTQSNNANFDAGLADEVARLFFPQLEPEDSVPETESAEDDNATPEPNVGGVGVESYDALVGRYEFEEMPGFVLEITRNGDVLYGQATGQPRLSLAPQPDGRFQVAGEQIFLEFLLEDDGTCPALVLHQNGEHRADRIEDVWEPTAADLEAYAGRYFSEELETFYSLEVRDGTLTIVHRRFELALRPGAKHEFAGGYPIAEVEFEVDDDGRPVTLVASSGRTRGIRFERVE
ncbi:MAG: serine hydrolase domain-containing protein [Phycisphaerales bacterium JB040]